MRDEEEEEMGFFAKHKAKVIVGGVLLASLVAYFALSPKQVPKKKS